VSWKAELKKRSEAAVARFIEELGDMVRPRCVLLFGSYARGNFTEGGDVDVCVVADGLPADIFARRHVQGRVAIPGVAAIGFAPAEFLESLEQGNFLVPDIMADGVPVFDEGYYEHARAAFAATVQRRGLVREEKGWRFRVAERRVGVK
jgi:hypothetical protein